MSLANKYYSLCDKKDLQEVLNFHCQTNFQFLDYPGIQITNNLSQSILEDLEFSEQMISPFCGDSISCKASDIKIRRKASANSFANQKIPFETLESLLCNSFSCSEDGRRPYPSAGALYPVDILVAILASRLDNFPGKSGIYHFRPKKAVLQPLLCFSDDDLSNLLISGKIDENYKLFRFAIIYVANIYKMIIKYKLRGYRHALMEVGSMYQQADMVSNRLDLTTRLSSSFSDLLLCKKLGLDETVNLPIVKHFFGQEQLSQ